MIKKWVFYFSLALLIGYISAGFRPVESNNHNWFESSNQKEIAYLFPSQNPNDYANRNVPFTGRFFIGFKEALAFKESQGKYHKINSLGYMGKYQFGAGTLQTIGITDTVAFMNSPKLQEKAFVALLAKNKWELRNEIEAYIGKTISGVKITESGILAAAHLGGAGSVKRFLKSGGKRKCKDDYGTSVKSYMRDFGGYETSGIIAENNPKIK
jgi:hypothetical protein